VQAEIALAGIRPGHGILSRTYERAYRRGNVLRNGRASFVGSDKTRILSAMSETANARWGLGKDRRVTSVPASIPSQPTRRMWQCSCSESRRALSWAAPKLNYPNKEHRQEHLLAPFVSGIEFFGGIFLLVGFMTRISAGALGITMIVAIASAKWEMVDSLETLLGFDETEYLALFLWLAIAGAGAISVDQLLIGRTWRRVH
jgi:uncharacterized membrane protein YphA (DoxX/SURF4 family)